MYAPPPAFMQANQPACAPCARCGAPMREQNAAQTTAMQVVLVCAFCGAYESVPAEHNQKMIALRTLNAQRRWAEDVIRGPALTLLRWREGGTMVTYLASYGFMLLMVLGTAASQWSILFELFRLATEETPAGDVARQAIALQVGMAGGVLGVSVATIGSVFWISAMLKRELAPYASASPPSMPGRPMRCRRCGAELVVLSSGVVTCGFCRAENFVQKVDAHMQVAQMAQIVRAAQQMAIASKAHMDAINGRVRSRLMLAFFLGGPLGAILCGVAAFVLVRL